MRRVGAVRTGVAPVGASFGYQPALDGVRALAVAMVLVFHAGFSWMPGGYVGVSVFFTLSGFLITSLGLVEHDRRGRVGIGSFYGRRVRRLLPASLLCITGVLLLAWIGAFRDDENLRRDSWGALAQIYNWVALAGDQTYADLVAGGGAAGAPLDHYWSLSIEEQFYWVWPIALAGIVRWRDTARRWAVGGLAALAAVGAPLIAAQWGPDAAYWATPARLAEILIGALLAVVLHRRPRLPRATWLLAPTAIGVIVGAAFTWPSANGPAYTGWFPAFAVASAALLLGLQVESPVSRVLSTRLVVALGAISYGVYLFHWPIFLAVDERTGLPQVPLFVVRIVLTLAAATASFVLLELPIRRARRAWRPTLTAGAVACSVLALFVAVLPAGGGEELASSSVDPSAGDPDPAHLLAVTTTAVTPAADATTAAPPSTTLDSTSVPPLPPALTRPARIMVIGDSTALATGDGMVSWAEENPALAEVVVVAAPGCGFIRAGVVPTDEDDTFRVDCAELLDAVLPVQLAEFRPDIVVAMVTLRDVEDRIWDDAEGPLGPLDQRFLDRMRVDYEAMTRRLLDSGVTEVLWAAMPIPDVPYQGEATVLLDPARYARRREVLETMTSQFPGRVELVDMAAWLSAHPDAPPRKDGLHWSRDGALAIAERFLGPVAVHAATS